MKKTCDRRLTNAEVVYKMFHELLIFLWKLVKLIFKSKLHSTIFVLAVSCALMFFSMHLTLEDCVNGTKYILSFL